LTKARRLSRLLAIGAACAALVMHPRAAQAKTSLDEAMAPDPFIKVNRLLFYVGGAIDFVLIRPAAMTYGRVMPRAVRTGLANAFSNMGEPTVAINDMLQGRGAAAARALARFAGNSTLGLAGLFDIATRAGLSHHANDFGVTLATYGVRSGPYVFVPVLGPATVRDLAGQLVDLGLNPLTYLHYPQSTAVGYGRAIGTGLEDRDASD
jgi:phospholipid-binding lipoprotein MlaA